jgi:hypothetical protein
MPNQFSEAMSERTDAELIRILNDLRNDYQPEAIIAAEEEFAKRNISEEILNSTIMEEVEEIRRQEESKKDEPLTDWQIARTILFPGWLMLLLSRAYRLQGYERKAKDLKKYTAIGCGGYIAIILLFFIIFGLASIFSK